ncbi:hypothetical protein Taro_049202 [Colocasia esculenta]|uniref:DJ-1/PfpI domain-containing protein n=1 Tax=Colocasia esculenta TaxID=4460 RepID=A0A843XAC0_COLES|nr:hypothetical protein [Colocasia esculenta]
MRIGPILAYHGGSGKTRFADAANLDLQSQQVLVPIANGSEEMEVVMVVDILRRAKIDVVVASVEKSTKIVASQNSVIVADKSLSAAAESVYDLIILPAFLAFHGLPGFFVVLANLELFLAILRLLAIS